ncbi:helix-turn-helix domain-containing protein [Leifsonia aquatica]|uniref:helix-turn-helix domain-containing protein n=1 Tax=Leifsonia aquatica TaxID=144185 RepID=UPI0037F95EC6
MTLLQCDNGLLALKYSSVSDPKFRPREYMVDPAGFGRVESSKFLEPSGSIEDAVRIRASKWQHTFAYLTRDLMRAKRLNQKDLAARSHMSYDRVSRVLRGDVLLRLEDMAAFERVLGEDFVPWVLRPMF